MPNILNIITLSTPFTLSDAAELEQGTIMANEATVLASLVILKDNISYRGLPIQFRADVFGSKGPTPGAITVTTSGTDVDLTQLTTPGLCRLHNLDTDNRVEYGAFNGVEFIPFGELLPGESTVFRFARTLFQSFEPGTGTVAYDTDNTFRIRAYNAACNVVVDAFER